MALGAVGEPAGRLLALTRSKPTILASL